MTRVSPTIRPLPTPLSLSVQSRGAIDARRKPKISEPEETPAIRQGKPPWLFRMTLKYFESNLQSTLKHYEQKYNLTDSQKRALEETLRKTLQEKTEEYLRRRSLPEALGLTLNTAIGAAALVALGVVFPVTIAPTLAFGAANLAAKAVEFRQKFVHAMDGAAAAQVKKWQHQGKVEKSINEAAKPRTFLQRWRDHAVQKMVDRSIRKLALQYPGLSPRHLQQVKQAMLEKADQKKKEFLIGRITSGIAIYMTSGLIGASILAGFLYPPILLIAPALMAVVTSGLLVHKNYKYTQYAIEGAGFAKLYDIVQKHGSYAYMKPDLDKVPRIKQVNRQIQEAIELYGQGLSPKKKAELAATIRDKGHQKLREVLHNRPHEIVQITFADRLANFGLSAATKGAANPTAAGITIASAITTNFIQFLLTTAIDLKLNSLKVGQAIHGSGRAYLSTI